uniref:Uncharacterized protein n=1 Tax=Rhodosorus marinus TaxID=101924 RepID=A0A7S2ZB54_9RHOD|mmetsp:Transcript_11552/g.48049  ORF Transcript_11552/g.48049 Transcript_11552/m.48049 type:complete len:299 (+) Transcript_11552:949-1845(+)|eukprot:CAMPEP_0113959824 /NCGR_PEP_ID=MMETSP0011_2-20120614/4363_1 /TAXON_ID=101924 /ORGANISM="Rhodosorus marinus" /LENGTH=298 /DNA_ID=CAMNT_0000971187 /DNA_START=760 /DNA_END=1656 /DNA_ORIENTATION=- /assembly_acc=CAM_ASM_000156
MQCANDEVCDPLDAGRYGLSSTGLKEQAFNALFGTFLTGTASIAGVAFFKLTPEQKHLFAFLLNFSAGAMMADVFVHILPHSYGHHSHSHEHEQEHGSHDHSHATSPVDMLSEPGALLVLGVVIFIGLDRITRWLAERGNQRLTSVATLNLAADALHNVADGMAIAAAYMTNAKLGRATVIVSWLHELPQELGDYAVLTSSGLSRSKALALNFLCGMVALFGTALVLFLGAAYAESAKFILPLAAGGMLYNSLACVIPEAMAADPGGPSLPSKIIAFARQVAGLGLGLLCLMLISLLE